MTTHVLEQSDVIMVTGAVIGILSVLIIMMIYFKRRSIKLHQQDTHLKSEISPLLRANAKRLGLVIHTVEGQTMYAAFADQLLTHNPTGTYDSDFVKNRAVDNIIRNKDDYSPFMPKQWDGNVETLTKMKGWQKEILMFHAIANALSRTIEVVHGDRMESTVIRPFNIAVSQSTQVLYVGYCGCEMYVSLRLEKQSTSDYQETDRKSTDCQDCLEERSTANVIQEGRFNSDDSRDNILIGDGAHQYIVNSPSNGNNSDEYVITRNIVVGEGNTQNVLATFRTANDLLEFLKTMLNVGIEGSQPMLRLKIRQKSNEISVEEIENSERRLIELLQDETSEARQEVNEILENFGVSFETATLNCILLHLTPHSNEALHDFVRRFQNGELVSLISFLIYKQYNAKQGVSEIDVQLQMQINLSDIEQRQIVNQTDSRRFKKGDARKTPTKAKNMSPGLSLTLKKLKVAKSGFAETDIPEKVTETLLKYFRRTGSAGRNTEIDVRFEKFCSTYTDSSASDRLEVLQNTSNMVSDSMKGCAGVIRSENGKITGTCFRVGNKYIMTACHVVNEMLKADWSCIPSTQKSEIFVEFADIGEKYHTRVKYTNEDLDVAVLEMPEADMKFGTLTRATDCQPGLSFYLVGFPTFMHGRKVEKTVVVSTDYQTKLLSFSKVLFESEKFERGCSGSPGVALIDGRVNIVTMLLGSLTSETDVLCYGVKMIDVYNRLQTDRPDIARNIFHQSRGRIRRFHSKIPVKIYGLFVCVSVAYMYLSRKYLYLHRDISTQDYTKIIVSLLKVNKEIQKVAVMLNCNRCA